MFVKLTESLKGTEMTVCSIGLFHHDLIVSYVWRLH